MRLVIEQGSRTYDISFSEVEDLGRSFENHLIAKRLERYIVRGEDFGKSWTDEEYHQWCCIIYKEAYRRAAITPDIRTEATARLTKKAKYNDLLKELSFHPNHMHNRMNQCDDIEEFFALMDNN